MLEDVDGCGACTLGYVRWGKAGARPWDARVGERTRLKRVRGEFRAGNSRGKRKYAESDQKYKRYDQDIDATETASGLFGGCWHRDRTFCYD